MSKRFAYSALLVMLISAAAALTGCPDPSENAACGDDPCPRLTACDADLERCVAPNDVDSSLVTRGPSLAVTPDGALYIAAYVGSTKDLAFGVWDREEGEFRYHLVDQSGDVGSYAALAVDAEGTPAIAYFDATHLRAKFAILRDDDTWHIEVIDETASVGTDIDLAIDDEGVAHVAYRDFTHNRLRYARRYDGVWRIYFVDTASDLVSGIPEGEACPAEQRDRVGRGVGFDAHIAVQGSTPVISYFDADCGALRLARGGAEGFTLRVVDGWSAETWAGPSSTPGTSVGRFSDLAVDPLGQLIVAYFDASLGVLKVARSPAGVPTIEVADDGRRDVEGEPATKRIVGQMPSIAFDSQGTAVVTHLDAETGVALITTSSDGLWATQAIEAPQQGFETDLVIGPDDTRYVVSVNRSLPGASPVSLTLRAK